MSVTVRRADYAPPPFLVDRLTLAIDIGETRAKVRGELRMRRNPAAKPSRNVELYGVGLETRAIAVDGAKLVPADWRIEGEVLEFPAPAGEAFKVVTEVEIDPWANTALSGLYPSGDMLCTQCEPEGFRRITWYPDRPDVMARFHVSLTADRKRFPILLSNGNLVEAREVGDGRHRTIWDDPFPKPSYLFACVAGDLAKVESSFRTMSGREVALRFWVEHGSEDQVPHAMASLKRAMKWDEDAFGREYDLDLFNVVAVSHFNMGAMENKSLNIFNSKYVLAKRETATDDDFLAIEGVIGHEYFHNWTGDRITCRDWFQLTLKEGLTVFRDQQFSADMNSQALNRVRQVAGLRAGQFPEDSGPMAHPIRPDHYEEINNFYTATVYQKGAEVIRMIHTLLGPEGFRRGMDLYFARHDGQAVTCEDFVAAMEDANGADFGNFRRWYEQAGTPRVSARWEHDPKAATLSLSLAQFTPPTPGQPDKLPLTIPVRLGLVGKDGSDLPLRLEGENDAVPGSRVLTLDGPRAEWVFQDVPEPALPSLFRGFSAPIILDAPHGDDELAFLMGRDSDPFGKWEAGQQLAARMLLARVGDATLPPLSDGYAEAWGRVLDGADADPAFTAAALALPLQSVLGEMMGQIDVDGIYRARKAALTALAGRYKDRLLAIHDRPAAHDDDLSPAAIGSRQLRNLALAMLAMLGTDDIRARAEAQYRSAKSMTNQLAALGALMQIGPAAAEGALDSFYEQWKGDQLVVNKWLTMQALADWPDVLARVRALQSHPGYDAAVPNKIYALISAFAGNIRWFNDLGGAGYAFIGDEVAALDPRNPQVASRLARSLIRWKRFDPARQALMKAQLERLSGQKGLSRDTAEIVNKALA